MDGARVEVIEPLTRVTTVCPVIGEPAPVVGVGTAQTARIIGRFVAATVLGGHRVVTLDDAGQLVYAQPTVMSHMNRPVFVTEGAWDAGAVATVTAYGPVSDSSFDWTPGRAVYIGTDGLLTQDRPAVGYLRKVAFPAEVQSIWFDPKQPIRLS